MKGRASGVSPAFPSLFYRQPQRSSVKKPPTGAQVSSAPHLGICNVIQAVITLKTKKTTGTKTGGWNAA